MRTLFVLLLAASLLFFCVVPVFADAVWESPDAPPAAPDNPYVASRSYHLDARDIGWVTFLVAAVIAVTILLILSIKYRK